MTMVNTPNGQVSNTKILKAKALLVRLNRSKLSKNKMDKDLGAMVRDMKNVGEAGALRVNKSLFTKECTDAYMKVYNEGSKYFYQVTLPWDDSNWRLLSIDLFEDFQTKMKTYTQQYRTAVMNFIEQISTHVEAAKWMLGEAFNQDDYTFIAPDGSIDTDFLLKKFSFEVEFNTVTDGDDLRATLTEADREVIAEQINRKATEKFQRANEHIIESLRDSVLAIHERLCKDENVFRDTLISNLEDLCDLIPAMNITGDPVINSIAADAKTKLAKWEPSVLRDDTKIRKEVAKDASKILDSMKGII